MWSIILTRLVIYTVNYTYIITKCLF